MQVGGSPTVVFLCVGNAMGFSIVARVSASMILNTSSRGRCKASAKDHPVNRTATTFK